MPPTLFPTTTAALLSWGLQSTLVLGMGWLLYRYALRTERFFGYNERFLVLAPWLALLGPLLVRAALPGLLRQLPIAATGALVQARLPGLTVRPEAALPAVVIDFAQWLPGLYVLGVALLLLRCWRRWRTSGSQPAGCPAPRGPATCWCTPAAGGPLARLGAGFSGMKPTRSRPPRPAPCWPTKWPTYARATPASACCWK
ncbi:hypothetical protein [Hymenobacter lapidiphilus]|uniref:hypothetical protein n=1 Tax=Hymenobacter sp. CCM 8763 TaxID=2303334 RepID=UPI001F5B898D|nr:hypothetical protein [Hymenobacter sp. CCM 8763]